MEYRIIAHPEDIPRDIEPITDGKARGPLGFGDYLVNDLALALRVGAKPYAFTIPTIVFSEFSMADFVEVLKAHVKNRIGATVESVECHDIGGIRYCYPRCKGEYIYVTEKDEKLLEVDTLGLVGYIPIKTDSNHVKLTNPYIFEGLVFCAATDLYPFEYEKIMESTCSFAYDKQTAPHKTVK